MLCYHISLTLSEIFLPLKIIWFLDFHYVLFMHEIVSVEAAQVFLKFILPLDKLYKFCLI